MPGYTSTGSAPATIGASHAVSAAVSVAANAYIAARRTIDSDPSAAGTTPAEE
ncbi:hypothetical protein MNVI_40610 [Mycobacterium noviomagense]|uniref:Uncharacterized protein n=1 Tax=Mycobacterium noviomagense TaxID=459858 RepID=A0A7I7PJD8_9MYCO|nr:hypothetical protein MNVI_40610 [Mycobacterium noviomagense]